MSVEYTKNLYKQNISFANYVQVLEDSRYKVVSLDLIDTIITYIIEDKDQKKLLECLLIFHKSIIKKLEWSEVFSKSNFLEIISNIKLEHEAYVAFCTILTFYESNGFKCVFNGKRFDQTFLKKHFYNYALYKDFFEPTKFDNKVETNLLDALQIGIYKRILGTICIENRENCDLREYLNTIDFEINFHRAIVDRNRQIDITKIPIEHIFRLYPDQIINPSNLLLCQFYLCSSSPTCLYCGKKMLQYNYDVDTMENMVKEETEKIKTECINQVNSSTNMRHRRFMETKSNSSGIEEEGFGVHEIDFVALAYFINHKQIKLESILIKTLLRAANIIENNDHIVKSFSHLDLSIDEHENILLYYVKNLTENIPTKNVLKEVRTFLKIFDSLQASNKITFACFVLLYQFYKESKNTKFRRDFALNEVYRRKSKIMKIIKWVLEYHITRNSDITECFEDNFVELCCFLSEDNHEKFVEQHMYLIYPIIYSRPEYADFVEDKEFNAKNFHFIIINSILLRRTDTAKDLFKEYDHSEYTIYILVHLLLNGFYDVKVFKTIFENWDTLLEKNIIRILFELRKKYFEQFEFVSICIFHMLRNLLTNFKDKTDICNRIYPFIESFVSKGCKNCADGCLEVFVKFFTSTFPSIPHANRIHMIFEFEEMIKSIEKNALDKNLNNVYSLIASKGYLRRSFSQKALLLFRAIFSNGEDFNDEFIIRNYINSFMNDLEVSKAISKIYSKVNDQEFIKIIGYIPEKLLFKEVKRKLSGAPILQENLKDIAKVSIEKYVMNVEIEDQDLYYYILQEISKYCEDTSHLPSHLMSSRYTMIYEPTNDNREVYKKTYRYEDFLDGLFIHLLFFIKEAGETDYYNYFKYGNLLGIKYLEYTTYQLFNVAVRHGNMNIVYILEDIMRMDGVNYKTIKFLVNLDIYTKNQYFDINVVMEKSLLVGDYHYCIYLLEKSIRKTNDRNLYNYLQYMYYKVGDFIRTRAINTKFSRMNSTNLFFEFILDRCLDAARDCLSKEESTMIAYLTDILNENEEDGFVKQCSLIVDDLSEWKNINSTNRLCLHFLKDCEMVENSDNLTRTLKVITDRRRMAGEDLLLIKCHYYLVKAVNNRNEVDANNLECTLESLGGSGIYSSSRQEDDYDSKRYFEQELNYSYIRKLIEQEEYDKATKVISSLLSKKDWGVLYEFSDLYLKQNKVNKSKECLKKVLNLFPKTTNIYRKALIKHAELVDTKQMYEQALIDIKDSSYLYLLYAKKLDVDNPTKSIEFYVNSVLISDEHKFETIPKIFHILSELTEKKNIKTGVKLVEELVKKNIGIFLPFFSQIITRLSHKNKEIADLIENIILQLMDVYQSETHWKAILLMNSNDSEIRQRTNDIITRLSLDKKIFLNNIKRFSEILSTLACRSDKEISIDRDFPEVHTIIISGDINVPNMSVKIEGVDNHVEVYSSLQAPKKISFIGSDGKIYRWLCKYRDDLRKDSRFMELNCLINSLFSKNKSSNYIRTYEVIPFSHSYGIIEFIDGLTSLKSICNELYSRENISISNVTKKYAKTKKIKTQNFREVISMFPPRFYKWFEENFNSPYNWYTARDNYTKTCAVMNIMGWFMGLGDRHADNILFDVNVGDTVHVDLNSIFESSKKLSIPERVPFRLTHNLIDAFGVLGLEGIYTHTMNETFDLFLKNKSLIISNLLSFVYDPLHEWRTRKEKAPKLVLDVLEKKLSPTDVISKVESLNEEAMADSNLGEMYIGWLPFI